MHEWVAGFFQRRQRCVCVAAALDRPREQNLAAVRAKRGDPATPGSSTSWSRRRGITSSSTPTTGSRPTTADSNTGCDRCAGYARTGPQLIISGHAFMQNLRRGHYELAAETARPLRVAAAFTELAQAI